MSQLLPGAVASRQSQLILPGARDATVIVAGAGMLGSWTVHALVRMCTKVILFDGGDTVEPENTGNQAFNGMNVEMPKGQAMSMNLYGLPLESVAEKFPFPYDGPVNVVVSCVDDLHARRCIAEWAYDNEADLFIDTRAQEETACVLCVPLNKDDSETRMTDYMADIPEESEVADVACGMTGTAFVGMWVAQRVAMSINNHYRGVDSPSKLVYHVGQGIEVTREMYGDANLATCDDCGAKVKEIVGCPDGAEVCQACFYISTSNH